MTRFVLKALTAVALVLPQFALAQANVSGQEHEVLIEKRGYFPLTIHIDPGDRIKFVNKSGNWARLYTEDYNDNKSGYDPDDPCRTNSSGNPYYNGQKDGWSTGWIPNNGERVVIIHGCSETNLRSPYVYQYGGNNGNYRGDIRFDEPDLGQ